jgi:hypothetical protein
LSSPRDPKKENQQDALAVARINSRQVIVVTIITALSGLLGALIQNRSTSGKIETLNQQLASSASKVDSLKEDSALSADERAALYSFTSEALEEDDLSLTGGKGELVEPRELPRSEVSYRRLRRAVFLNMVPLRANRAILDNTLEALINQGYEWIRPHKARLVSEFPEIQRTRLIWLKDVAIPALEKSRNELEATPGLQEGPMAKVPLPEPTWIVPRAGMESAKVTVTNLRELKAEEALLRRALSNTDPRT